MPWSWASTPCTRTSRWRPTCRSPTTCSWAGSRCAAGSGAAWACSTGTRCATRPRSALARLGINLRSLRVPVRNLSGGQRQALAVARSITWATTAVLMDEPTAALGPKQSAIVYETVTNAAARGLAVLVISHDIPRMLHVADRIAVMRHGLVVAERPASSLKLTDVIGLMLGEEVVE